MRSVDRDDDVNCPIVVVQWACVVCGHTAIISPSCEGVKDFAEKKLRFLGKKIIDATRGVGYDQCMNNTELRNRIYAILNDTDLDDDDCNFSLAIRDLLITDEIFTERSNELTLPQRRAMLELRDLLELADTELITELRLSHSLCPLHACDYAICFDDQNDECATIRLIHPSHDT